MNLITRKIEDNVPKLYETEKIKLEKKVAKIKLDHNKRDKSWYIVEAEKLDNDFVFWGLIREEDKVAIDFFSLNDLASMALDECLAVTEDMTFSPTQLSLIM
ncbi:MAG: hypothetical protein HN353_04025 [Bdellovibrionales bacterium]|nr:hypothetical protein [Bdellovibrionales bacterium]MBT3525951.1 hypothetical protein [Bdellovibrionales bacterium]